MNHALKAKPGSFLVLLGWLKMALALVISMALVLAGASFSIAVGRVTILLLASLLAANVVLAIGVFNEFRVARDHGGKAGSSGTHPHDPTP